MHWITKNVSQEAGWFKASLVGLLLLSVALHFWGLERFNTLVFDEVYYPKYGQHYLTHTPFFDAHPPLGKYMIALGMWLSDHSPFRSEIVNNLTGVVRSPWSYRWFNALMGTLLPLIVSGIAYQLSQRRRFALLAGLFTAVDGLFLVESRYGLINIYLVCFGLLGHWLFLIALRQPRWRWRWLLLSGICLGAAIAVKWNGLGFLLGLFGIWVVAWMQRWLSPIPDPESESNRESSPHLFQGLRQVHWWALGLNLGLIPLLVYGLTWIPHLLINETSLWDVHQQMYDYHADMKSGKEVHPYCAAWHTWPLMLRPMSYFYETTRSLADPLPPLETPLPQGTGQVVYDVHAMGNPILWWSAVFALVVLLEMVLDKLPLWLGSERTHLPAQPSVHTGIILYVLLNYAANFLPWMKVTRCTFIYLYMPAAIFSFLAIAYLLDRWLDTPQPFLRALSVTIVFAVLIAFVFWLPVYLGLPITHEQFRQRMWLPTWI
jgi:dolichyl-phosphate-mannose--protein O-mannosyl transferase